MFQDLVSTLEAHNYGVRAYEQVAQMCYKSVAEQPEYAIYFLVLSLVAERFISRYDEYPLTISEADRQKERVLGWIETMEASLNKNKEEQLAQLNTISREALYI